MQIHFSGLALTAAVVVILGWLRPRMDWRFGVAGLVVALAVMGPYLKLQSDAGWSDFKQAALALEDGQQWEQLHGLTIDPVTGYRLPSRDYGGYALSIMNGGRIEDTLGIAADREFDKAQIWAHKGGGSRPYFAQSLTLGDWLLKFQRVWLLGALVWLLVLAVRAVRWPKVEGAGEQGAWIQGLWIAVPLMVFAATGLWTYLTYLLRTTVKSSPFSGRGRKFLCGMPFFKKGRAGRGPAPGQLGLLLLSSGRVGHPPTGQNLSRGGSGDSPRRGSRRPRRSTAGS